MKCPKCGGYLYGTFKEGYYSCRDCGYGCSISELKGELSRKRATDILEGRISVPAHKAPKLINVDVTDKEDFKAILLRWKEDSGMEYNILARLRPPFTIKSVAGELEKLVHNIHRYEKEVHERELNNLLNEED